MNINQKVSRFALCLGAFVAICFSTIQGGQVGGFHMQDSGIGLDNLLPGINLLL
jgi:hypothetical protein